MLAFLIPLSIWLLITTLAIVTEDPPFDTCETVAERSICKDHYCRTPLLNQQIVYTNIGVFKGEIVCKYVDSNRWYLALNTSRIPTNRK